MDSIRGKNYPWISLTGANSSLLTEESDSHEYSDRHKRTMETPTMETPKFTRIQPTCAGFPIAAYGNFKKTFKNHHHHPETLPIATSTPWRAVPPTKIADDVSFVSSISNYSAVERVEESRRRIENVEELIRKCKTEIRTAVSQLLEARRRQKIVEQLAIHRILTVEQRRLKLLIDEVSRLTALAAVRHTPPETSIEFRRSLKVSNISLQLNRNFKSVSSFAVLVILRCRTKIEATSVVRWHPSHRLLFPNSNSHDGIFNTVNFSEKFTFSKLPIDFVIGLDVFMMKVPERPKKKTVTARIRDHFCVSSSESPEENGEFQMAGHLELNSSHHSGDRQFLLDDVCYPLEGTIRLSIRSCSLPAPIEIETRGLLLMFEKNSTWQKYWAVLSKGKVHFWKNRVDEKFEKMPPLFQIDLTKCTNKMIESRDNEEFKIELLIDESPSLLEKRRVLLAAENSTKLEVWLNAINDTLWILRGQK